MVNISWEISAYKDPTVQRKSRLVKNFADIFYWNLYRLDWYNKYAGEISKKIVGADVRN